MKKIINLSIALLLVVSVKGQVAFCEDFDSFNTGDSIANESPSWNSWDELITGATAPFSDDAIINSNQSFSGLNSLYFPPTAVAGPEDILLMFDPTLNITQSTLPSLSTPYLIGQFTFSQMMYVRAGAGAYFNLQAENIPGTSWALEVNFTDNGTTSGDILMSNTGGTSFSAEYPVNTWFEIKFDINLSNNNWEVLVDGVSFGSFANSINKIASLDLYPRINDEFYVDDVCYTYTPGTLPANNGQVSNISPISGLTSQTRYPSVEIRNFGIDPIYSCDVTFDYNGIQTIENLTNINLGAGLLSLTSMQVDFLNPITLIAGTNTGTATISNVNGMLVDDDPSDDVMTTQITAITPAAGKLVIGEEATGTWCQWCPRGAVALNWMDKDYEGYWQGIAVHNGDPMTDSVYDNGMAPYIGGYPSGLVDRGPEIDPGDFEQDFLQRIVIPPHAFISNNIQINGNTLSVSACLDFQNNINGNWKFACAVVEDSVTGTSTGYNQANAYVGGGAGPLVDVDGSDWASKPGSVPASQMIYRHVGRSIKPSFAGDPLPLTVYNIGDQECIDFTFTLDPSWEQCQISIVSMLFDDQGNIDNASSSKLITPSWDCNTLTNTCSDPCTGSGAYTSLADCQADCATTAINEESSKPLTYPNPVKNILTINGTHSSVEIYDIYGKLVLSFNTKKTINVSSLSKGVYLIKLDNTIRKLIKE